MSRRAASSDAYASARKAYSRSADRRGRPDLGALLDDRKARRETGNAASSLRTALRIATRTRKKPKSAKGPVVAVVVVAGAGTAFALNKNLRTKVLGPFGSADPETDGAAPKTYAPDAAVAQ